MILVSACLAGVACRYDASHKWQEAIHQLVDQKKAIMACPEVLGGLPTPRPPAEIHGGTGEDVLSGKAFIRTPDGQDVTSAYLSGAYQMLELARKHEASFVVLKENSPSCGSSYIYNGNFNGTKMVGEGVTCALLRKEGFAVMSEETFIHKLGEKNSFSDEHGH
ncbi:DUF523 domain-containing protein [Bacillaceae bacterium SIJ1]|uniref:DUF523 domain-containing protein n=1 Tax=Litoribacterium kuwaitense TaxID=1398745 RepID=UPI0013EDA689|nr:DUF523 domain-containing protein [Litoribacterium kuwaitense]NGP44591.1 DUF523 domain-containing protein [Litoribacterium kuwaitense]